MTWYPGAGCSSSALVNCDAFIPRIASASVTNTSTAVGLPRVPSGVPSGTTLANVAGIGLLTAAGVAGPAKGSEVE